MVSNLEPTDSRGQCLSELMDGQLEATAADQAFSDWRDDPAARERWHTYHLIGDVLRSQELARAPACDAQFMQTLRGRLAGEPVPLAPSAASKSVERRNPQRRWLMAPVAAVAGFVAVAGALVITRLATPTDEAVGAASIAQVSATPSRPLSLAPVQPQAQPEVMVASGQLIRDARLDRYLAAHRQVSYGAAAVVPGALVRSVDTVVLERK